ncbi:MAG: methionyl-tRNA formyltransferase [Bacillota bacterium]|nr:methionyl-tRNA formyltransferase [Bacillota bacterium]
MNIVFMGTPDFAVNSLESLIEAGHNVQAVFTQPDKPKGRGYTLTPPPVKVCAQEHNIEVYQPKTLKNDKAFEILKKLNPDVIVVVAYGKILPKNILDLPKFGCVNVHGSLLPKYRGAAPIQWAILNGEAKTGITTMFMDVGLDTGDMLLKSETNIGENETAGELHNRLAVMGAKLIVKTLDGLQNGTITREKQNDDESCYAAMLDKNLCKIDFNEDALQVHNKIRGLSPWPTATAVLHEKNVKIHKSKCVKKSGNPGEVILLSPLTIACKTGAVEISELQLDGKKRMKSDEFLRGHPIKIGEKFN